MAKEKPRNGGQWTEARYNSFIKGALRQAWTRWGPNNNTKRKARVARGVYLCNGCKQQVPASLKIDGVRKNNIFTDHIEPVVDPSIGFVSWDSIVDRMFVEEDVLQCLCKACHDVITAEERAIATERKRMEKLNGKI